MTPRSARVLPFRRPVAADTCSICGTPRRAHARTGCAQGPALLSRDVARRFTQALRASLGERRVQPFGIRGRG